MSLAFKSFEVLPHQAALNPHCPNNLITNFLPMQLDDGLRKLMNATTDSWKADSSLLTYGGGSRSRRSGIFSGVTDIQGMDMCVEPMNLHVYVPSSYHTARV